MKTLIAAAAALALSTGAFAAGAANPTNDLKIAPANPAHGPASAQTLPERAPGWARSQPQPAYTDVQAIHTNEGSIHVDHPAPVVNNHMGYVPEQSNELKIGPAAPAHGPASAHQR